MPYFLFVMAFVAVAFCLIYFNRDKLSSKFVNIFVKCCGIALFVLIFAKCFLADGFVYVINGGYFGDTYYKQTDVVATFVRWFVLFDGCLAVTSVFTSKVTKQVLIYFGLPTAVFSLAFFNRLLGYYTVADSPAMETANWVRIVGFGLEMSLIVLLPLIYRFVQGYKLDFHNKAEVKSAVKLCVFGFVCSMPFLTLGSLFGSTDSHMQMGDVWHVCWMLSIVVAFCAMYFAFRNEGANVKREFVYYLIIYIFVHYNSIYTHGIAVSHLPFQLCNIGAYLLLALMFTNSQKLFDFTLIANCVGCLIAIITVPMDDNLLEFWSSHYYVEHSLVFVIPLLAVALGLFKMPTFAKGIKHYFVGFSVFFAVCFVLNYLENGVLAPAFGELTVLGRQGFFNNANFFYLMDCPIGDMLPFAPTLQQTLPITIFGVSTGLPYLAFIYVVFSAICIAVFALIKGVCALLGKFMGKTTDNSTTVA